MLPPADFKSDVSSYSTIPAYLRLNFCININLSVMIHNVIKSYTDDFIISSLESSITRGAVYVMGTIGAHAGLVV